MSMNFMNQQDGPSQSGEAFSEAGSEQEFSFVEEKKPINRNAIVLLAIALVGGALVYYMYQRGTTAVPVNNEAVASAEKTLNEIQDPLKKIEADLSRTSDMVASFQDKSSEGQVPLERLKTNPFSLTVASSADTKVTELTSDPAEAVRLAVAKVKVQTILYSSTNSTCFVNNRIYAEGQTINIDGIPLKIRAIQPDHIVLHHPLGRFDVALAGKTDLSK